MSIESKVLVVGLTPEYYSSSVRKATSDYQASMRSTNMGASFITRSITSIFNADYLDISSSFNISEIKNKYDVCVVSLASHLGPSRNVDQLVKFLKDVDLRTVFLSGGLDAAQDGSFDIHRSVKDLLELCSVDNQWIGVRGYASALYLHRQGINNVVPIGCPTMYSKYSGDISPSGSESKNDIAVPFHWSIAGPLINELLEHSLIGQDAIDEELFLEGNSSRVSRNISERFGIHFNEAQHKLEKAVSSRGFFPSSYEAWYDKIGAQEALLSGRLHAAICGLTQGVPTVLAHWDLRTHEIVDYFKLPSVTGEEIQNLGSLSAFKAADFGSFNDRQKICWSRWNEFLNQNEISQNSDLISFPSESISSCGEALHNDNNILKMASNLQARQNDSELYQVKRLLRLLRRSLNLARQKLKFT